MTMAEKMARAYGGFLWEDEKSLSEHYGAEKVRASQLSLANETMVRVLEAMREPSEAMMNSGMNAAIRDWQTAKETFCDDPSPVWRAMIDAAILEAKQ